MSVSTNNSIRTLELVEEPHVDLTASTTLPGSGNVTRNTSAQRFRASDVAAVEEAWQAVETRYLNQAKGLSTKHGDWLDCAGRTGQGSHQRPAQMLMKPSTGIR